MKNESRVSSPKTKEVVCNEDWQECEKCSRTNCMVKKFMNMTESIEVSVPRFRIVDGRKAMSKLIDIEKIFQGAKE